ncbi:MAG: hypothetical protein DMF89_19105 [Acidobacteria bacterium]|nr:MAG: hypothetical protein DMF89_19105 [Acidobacteriota bacterium]
MDDYAKLARAERVEVGREVERIFSAAGVRVEWLEGLERLKVDGRFRVAIIILDRTMGTRQIVADGIGEHVLGEAIPPARRAYVFHHRVARLLFNDPGKLGQALGAVAAHEIGHLLLPEASHSAEGIMQPHVPFNLIVPQRFTDAQSAAIRTTLAALHERSPARLPAEARAAK